MSIFCSRGTPTNPESIIYAFIGLCRSQDCRFHPYYSSGGSQPGGGIWCRGKGEPRPSTYNLSTESGYQRGTTRAEVVQGTPTQSHISPSIQVYEENPVVARCVENGTSAKDDGLVQGNLAIRNGLVQGYLAHKKRVGTVASRSDKKREVPL